MYDNNISLGDINLPKISVNHTIIPKWTRIKEKNPMIMQQIISIIKKKKTNKMKIVKETELE